MAWNACPSNFISLEIPLLQSCLWLAVRPRRARPRLNTSEQCLGKMGVNWRQKEYLQQNQDKTSFIRPDSPFQPTQADLSDLYFLPKPPGHPVSPAQHHTGQALLRLPHLTFAVAVLSIYCLHLCPTSPSSSRLKMLSGVKGFAHSTLTVLPGAEINLPFLVPKEFAT